jgi:hypothetical protein
MFIHPDQASYSAFLEQRGSCLVLPISSLRFLDGNPFWDEKASIRQEYFQSFIKRIVKILLAIIAIRIHSGFQGLTALVDIAERFPL